MLLSKLRHSTFLNNKGITLDVEPHDEPIVMNDGSKLTAVRLKISAETAEFCAMGYGFVVAIHEGVHKLQGAS
jgi:archaeosine-15-forming tRNA-guanine transglycosylase